MFAGGYHMDSINNSKDKGTLSNVTERLLAIGKLYAAKKHKLREEKGERIK
jgi:hypothetical protein